MKTKTLYVSDLDGTLLGTDSRVSQASASIISELTGRGAMITVATARTPATVVPLLSSTLTTPPAVVMTGTSYWLRQENRFDGACFVPTADVSLALELCRGCGVHPFVYTMAADDRSLDVFHAAPSLNKAEQSFYEERSHLVLKRFHLGTPAPVSAYARTMLLYAMGPRDCVLSACEVFRTQTDCSVSAYPDIFNNDIYNLEIFPPGISKASAVEALKERVGADRLVVFGDNLNDLPMLAVADVAVAVGNALPEVREAADIVIEPNYTDSVARFIQSDFDS